MSLGCARLTPSKRVKPVGWWQEPFAAGKSRELSPRNKSLARLADFIGDLICRTDPT